jgi:hypothetical protein
LKNNARHGLPGTANYICEEIAVIQLYGSDEDVDGSLLSQQRKKEKEKRENFC